MSAKSPSERCVYHAEQPKSVLFRTFSLRDVTLRFIIFWMASCNILSPLISVGSDRALPSCPSGQQRTLRCRPPLGGWLGLERAEQSLIPTARTCPVSDTRGVASQHREQSQHTHAHPPPDIGRETVQFSCLRTCQSASQRRQRRAKKTLFYLSEERRISVY